MPLILTKEREACLLGSAILAMVGAGIFPDISSAVQDMVHVERTVVRKDTRKGGGGCRFWSLVFVAACCP